MWKMSYNIRFKSCKAPFLTKHLCFVILSKTSLFELPSSEGLVRTANENKKELCLQFLIL